MIPLTIRALSSHLDLKINENLGLQPLQRRQTGEFPVGKIFGYRLDYNHQTNLKVVEAIRPGNCKGCYLYQGGICQKDFTALCSAYSRYDNKPIPKAKRLLVYNKYNGHCAYCGCDIEYKDMQVDHIVSVSRTTIDNGWKDTQNDDLSNLMPSCRMCNYYKQESDIDGLRNKLENILMRNVRLPFDYRLAVKYGLVVENIQPIKFYFEKQTE